MRVEAGAVPDRVDLRVIDHGPGIPADQRDRVFQPFQRLGDNPRNGTGVGLGLAVARGFVEAMGGELTVEDTPGGGMTMVVSMPLVRDVSREPRAGRRRRAADPPRPRRSTSGRAATRSIWPRPASRRSSSRRATIPTSSCSTSVSPASAASR